MISYLVRKTGLLFGGWFCASILIFFVLRILPGDAAQIIGGTSASPEKLAQIRAELGLNEPLITQYFTWITGILHGDFGSSIITKTPISQQLIEKAEVSVPLLFLAMLFALLLALPLGFFAAYRGEKTSRVLSGLAALGAALPPVAIALGFIGCFAITLGWLPAQGFTGGFNNPLEIFRSLLLPALTLGFIEAAVLYRFVHSAVLQALTADPVRTGMSCGYTRWQATLRYGLPAASLSLIGTLGMQLASLLVGAVVIEQVFALPGIGSMLVASVAGRDLPKVAGLLFVITGAILVIGFATDVLQRVADPRLRRKGS